MGQKTNSALDVRGTKYAGPLSTLSLIAISVVLPFLLLFFGFDSLLYPYYGLAATAVLIALTRESEFGRSWTHSQKAKK